MIHLFDKIWNAVPIVVVDVETTGTVPGVDAAVQVALVRFEEGEPVDRFVTLLNPGRSIPIAATTIHGITEMAVKDAPRIGDVFVLSEVAALLKDAQPCAYNAQFDRAFVPLAAFSDWSWPWLDPLTMVRSVDRFVRGQGRHKLEAACGRRGITIAKAHDAGGDAEATGRLFYKIVPEIPYFAADANGPATVGELLQWQRTAEAGEWFRFNEWLARQPPRPEART